MRENIFLTGATGFVGHRLFFGLLSQRPQAEFWLMIRDSQKQKASERLQELLKEAAVELKTTAAALAERCHLVRGDLEMPRYGLDEAEFETLARRSDEIFHCAANVILEQPIEKARQMNLTGTLTAVDLAVRAQKLGGLKRFNHVSTAYVAGRRTGLILEEELDCGQAFNNGYEQVKFEGEIAVRRIMPDVPTTVFRPSMIMGDSKTGWTNSFNVLYGPIKMGYFGKLRVIPGGERSKVDTVPIDYVVNAMLHLSHLGREVEGKTFHLCVGPGRGLSVQALHHACHQHLEEWVQHYHLKNPRVIPRIIHPHLFRLLAFAAVHLSWGAHRRVFQRFQTYTDYTLYHKEFDTRQARALLDPVGIVCPLFTDYLRVMCKYCVETHFGTASGPRDVL